MKQARIYFKDKPAGILTESDSGYEFKYYKEYLEQVKAVLFVNWLVLVGMKVLGNTRHRNLRTLRWCR